MPTTPSHPFCFVHRRQLIFLTSTFGFCLVVSRFRLFFFCLFFYLHHINCQLRFPYHSCFQECDQLQQGRNWRKIFDFYSTDDSPHKPNIKSKHRICRTGKSSATTQTEPFVQSPSQLQSSAAPAAASTASAAAQRQPDRTTKQHKSSGSRRKQN